MAKVGSGGRLESRVKLDGVRKGDGSLLGRQGKREGGDGRVRSRERGLEKR